MSQKPKRPCLYHGCPEIVPQDKGYCDEHTPSWEESSAKYLYLNPLCHDCKRWRGIDVLSSVAYHVIPKEEGGTDW